MSNGPNVLRGLPPQKLRRWAGRVAGARRHDGGANLEHPLLSLPAVAYVLIGFCLPIAILFVYSFWPTRRGEVLVGDWTLSNYSLVFSNSIYWQSLLRSVLFVSVAALVTVTVTFPFAYFVALRVRPQRRLSWVLAAILPFSTSYMIRIFAWLNLLGDQGIVNDGLMRLHLINSPLALFGYGRAGIVLTFIYLLFPLSFLLTYVAIERMDPTLLESASDLGARPWRALARIVLPIARTGLLVSFAFSFISMMGDYMTPMLIGGTSGTLFSNLVVTKFQGSAQWGLGSALAFILVATMFIFLVVARRATGATRSVGEYTRRHVRQRSPFLLAYSSAFMIMLYAPIALLVLFAFNDAETIGFPIRGLTTHWFSTAFENPILLEALSTSLKVAAWALGVSLVFGTLAAVQLARARGRWRSMSLGILALPLFVPPMMLGLGMIIGLNAVGVTRGLWTVVAGHTLLLLPVITFIILVRLEGLDANLERAAMDLGAKPWQAFLYISVPQAFPGIVAAALIGFALSMDEFILTFLITGSDATLPLFIYGSVRFSLTPELNALSSVMLGGSFLFWGLGALVLHAGRVGRRRRFATAVQPQERES